MTAQRRRQKRVAVVERAEVVRRLTKNTALTKNDSYSSSNGRRMLRPMTMTALGIPSSLSFAIGTTTAAFGSSSQTLIPNPSIRFEQSSTRTSRRDCRASLKGHESTVERMSSSLLSGVNDRCGAPDTVETMDMVGEPVMWDRPERDSRWREFRVTVRELGVDACPSGTPTEPARLSVTSTGPFRSDLGTLLEAV